jgi:hypothetical protein
MNWQECPWWNEQEWLACNDPLILLRFLLCQRRAGWRNWIGRLLGGACHRSFDRRLRSFIAYALLSNSPYTTPELWEDVCRWIDNQPTAGGERFRFFSWCVAELGWRPLLVKEEWTVAWVLAREADLGGHGPQQCAFLRDLFGNPFCPLPRLPAAILAWNDGTVHRIAEGIYTERAFDRLPILADALEDAGCDNANILNHCRQPGVHVRGCWVIDSLLAKS